MAPRHVERCSDSLRHEKSNYKPHRGPFLSVFSRVKNFITLLVVCISGHSQTQMMDCKSLKPFAGQFGSGCQSCMCPRSRTVPHVEASAGVSMCTRTQMMVEKCCPPQQSTEI